MAITDPRDTLAFHKSVPLCVPKDISGCPTKTVMTALQSHPLSDHVHPEHDALEFYLMNHSKALLAERYHPYEPLPSYWQTNLHTYNARLSIAARRAFEYLLIICTRESRHDQKKIWSADQIKQKFGPEVGDFFLTASGGEMVHAKKLYEQPPLAPIGAYVDSLSWVFHNSSWSSGFGGHAWGNVADCLCGFVHGKLSAEMMLDVVWTLCHNGGPIFNKGFLYYTQNNTLLQRILDVQRAGQIPEMIMSDPVIWHAVKNELLAALTDIAAALEKDFPTRIGTYVDWFKVEKLGALGSYNDEKAALAPKLGIEYEAPTSKLKKTKKFGAPFAGPMPKELGLEISPNLWVPIVKMARVA